VVIGSAARLFTQQYLYPARYGPGCVSAEAAAKAILSARQKGSYSAADLAAYENQPAANSRLPGLENLQRRLSPAGKRTSFRAVTPTWPVM
jgi:hypothetical protein